MFDTLRKFSYDGLNWFMTSNFLNGLDPLPTYCLTMFLRFSGLLEGSLALYTTPNMKKLTYREVADIAKRIGNLYCELPNQVFIPEGQN